MGMIHIGKTVKEDKKFVVLDFLLYRVFFFISTKVSFF